MESMLTPGTRDVYLDHAATTAVHPEVVAAMLPFFTARAGNPSSVHARGRDANAGLEGARRAIAKVLGARPREIIFTGGGTEADNLAIKGAAWAHRLAGHASTHIITTAIEHHAITHSVEALEAQGFHATVLGVDRWGRVSPDEVAAALRPDTAIVSVMTANNEVGTIQPLAEIAALCRAAGVPFHTDAVQAGGALDLNVDRLGVDMLSLSAHKFYGPKGVGLLYVRTGTTFAPQQHGGGQEGKRRAGTENVPGIVGMAAALTRAYTVDADEVPRIQAMRDALITGILREIPDAHLHGHPTDRLPNNVAFCFGGVTGEDLLLRLDLAGICASSGSACNSGSTSISHVLQAMGVPVALGRGSLRLTLGTDNSPEDVDYTLATLATIIRDLRAHNEDYAPVKEAPVTALAGAG